MPKQPERIRPAVLVTILAVAGLVVLGLFVLNRSKTAEAHTSTPAAPAELPQPSHDGPPFRVTQQPVNSSSHVPSLSDRPESFLAKVVQRQSGPKNVPVSELLALIHNESAALGARRKAAKALGKSGSDEAFEAVKEILRESPSRIKAAIAEGLAESSHPDAKDLLFTLLDDQDEVCARGAVRGLGFMGSPEAVQKLVQTLHDENRPDSVRTEAALALGEMENPGAMVALMQAARSTEDPEIVQSILDGVGNRPISETREFFESYLQTPGLDSELKVAAIEALGNAEGAISDLLVNYTADADPEIRAAAAWALSASDRGEVGGDVLKALEREQDPSVRLRLYQALGNQQEYDLSSALVLVKSERDEAARLAAYHLLASHPAAGEDRGVLQFLQAVAVPELKATALNERQEFHHRLSSIMALGRAGRSTSAATDALQEVVGAGVDPRVKEAAITAIRTIAGH